MAGIRLNLYLPILILFLTPLCLAEGVVIGPSSRDNLFKQEPHIVCNDPVKGSPACSGLCTEMKLPYDEMKDINGRDANPARGFAKPEYFDLQGMKQHKIKISNTNPHDVTEVNKLPSGKLFSWDDAVTADQNTPPPSPGSLLTYEVGNPDSGKSCQWATIWVHGATPVKGGLGVSDNLFGGQFNRMKHLATDNHGMYYSPSIEDFGDDTALLSVIKRIRTKTCPKGKIILNCGSAGSSACWKLAADKRASGEIAGMVLIGSTGGPGDSKAFLASDLAHARVPVLFAQGEHDGPDHWRDLVLKIHASDASYPIRFVVYKDGGHMTPLRMMDWKSTMNCMLSQAPEVPGASGATTRQLKKSQALQ